MSRVSSCTYIFTYILYVYIYIYIYYICIYVIYIYIYIYIQGSPQKCPFFSLAITFTKIRKPSLFFSQQILEVYRILLVEATLESIMFYYTFSVINTIFVPCTTLLYDSTAANRTLKFVHNSIEHFLWNLSDNLQS